MLALPELGIKHSKERHNSRLDVVSDWVEASLLFSDDRISKVDLVDILMENEVYEDQDFALEFADMVWAVLADRVQRLNGLLGLRCGRDSVSRSQRWDECPAYAFCLMLSCGAYIYPRWAGGYGYDHALQGALFERLAERSVGAMLPGWNVSRTGWSPDQPVKLRHAVDGIISGLHEVQGVEADLYVGSHANELGLDLLAYGAFDDVHASFPVLMIQCASGKDWRQKRHTPDLNIWSKVINFSGRPLKGFAIPYAFTDAQEFRREAVPVNGVFLDRYRLLNPNRGRSEVWIDARLNEDLAAWVSPRLDALPRAAY